MWYNDFVLTYFLYKLFFILIEVLIPAVIHGLERYLISFLLSCLRGACLSIVAESFE